jgi:hypothetical protein
VGLFDVSNNDGGVWLPLRSVRCCNIAWVLKKSVFLKTANNWGGRKCLGKSRKSFVGILTRFYFCKFREKEFFNSHACLRHPSSHDWNDRRIPVAAGGKNL